MIRLAYKLTCLFFNGRLLKVLEYQTYIEQGDDNNNFSSMVDDTENMSVSNNFPKLSFFCIHHCRKFTTKCFVRGSKQLLQQIYFL